MTDFKIKSDSKNGSDWAIFNLNKSLNIDSEKKFNNVEEAIDAPLVKQLFYLPFVKSVIISKSKIRIERFNILEWNDVIEEVSKQIEDFLNNGGAIINKKNPVSIYAESTPNPSVMKFVANKKLTDYSIEYKNIGQARGSIFVVELFNFSYVKEVFISENYISITKNDSTDWNNIVLELREFIVASLKINNVITSGYEPEKNKSNKKKIVRKKIEKKIISILEEYVKPAVSSDGGDIVFDSYQKENKNVNVILKGACSGCPSSTITLKNGIENILKDMLPGEINSVNAING